MTERGHCEHARPGVASVQRRRELPTRATQALQVAIQNRIIQPALEGQGPIVPAPVLRLLDKVPLLQRIPAYLVGVGVRPEHVRTREVSRTHAA